MTGENRREAGLKSHIEVCTAHHPQAISKLAEGGVELPQVKAGAGKECKGEPVC